MPENCAVGHALGLPGMGAGRIVFETRVRVTSGAPGLRMRGQALAIAEVAAAADVIKISIVLLAPRHAERNELALGDCDVPWGQPFFLALGTKKSTPEWDARGVRQLMPCNQHGDRKHGAMTLPHPDFPTQPPSSPAVPALTRPQQPWPQQPASAPTPTRRLVPRLNLAPDAAPSMSQR